jgi:hypothetical protein
VKQLLMMPSDEQPTAKQTPPCGDSVFPSRYRSATSAVRG